MVAKAIVVANWKMNPPTFRDAKKLFEAERKVAERAKRSNVVIAPPAIFLRELRKLYHGSKISFAAQHVHYEAGGAHTGEISLAQVRDARTKYVLIGHAERRELGETDEETRKKTTAAVSAGLMPILCVGEKERSESGEQFEVVREQLRIGLSDVSAAKLSSIVITYEPLWTIGKKSTMSPHDMHQMAVYLRKCIVETHGEGGRTIKILYGGSVDEKNAVAMLREGDIRGFLVGRASINALEFGKLLQAIEHA